MDCFCVFAEELLTLALNGESLSFEAQHHVKNCACCRQQVSSYQAIAWLVPQVYRHQCPSALTLSYYCLPGALSVEEQDQVVQHLAQCPLCTAELLETSQFLKG